MPARNFYILLVALVVSLACYQKAQGRYARVVDTFVEAFDTVEREYVTDVDRQQVFDGALRGLTSSLDEHSMYVNPQQFRGLSEAIDQHFGGIGIEVRVDPKTHRLTVQSPIVGTPAFAAGVQPGDVLLEVDGRSTDGMSISDAIELLHGKVGQPVRLTIGRGDPPQTMSLTLRRANIQVDSVVGDTRDAQNKWVYLLPGPDRIGYIRIKQFGRETAKELKAALDQLDQQSAQGLILDLRDNPGGLFEEAIAVCDLFIDKGTIVSIRGRRENKTYEASPDDRRDDFPIVVLINGQSASAAEIVAACLQDHHRAVVVGNRSWGKGSVQNVFPLAGERSAIKLTTGTYWRPSEKNIHRMPGAKDTEEWGVSPDAGRDVPLSDEQWRALYVERQLREAVRMSPAAAAFAAPPAADPQLDAALQYLREQLSNHPQIATG